MPNQPGASIQNMFNGGLKTEFTGLNFPENSCTELDNCVISLIGDVLRRGGIDYELNAVLNSIDRTQKAINTYRWNNVGGDGSTQILVVQIGGILYFFLQTNATVSKPLSTTLLVSNVNLSTFIPMGGSSPNAVECQFSDGNGYLFVFHPGLESFFCTYISSTQTIAASQINVQIRDFLGIAEPGITFNQRLVSLSNVHEYNLFNQGWSGGNIANAVSPWTVNSNTIFFSPLQIAADTPFPLGSNTFILTGGNSNIQVGQTVFISGSASYSVSGPLLLQNTFSGVQGIVTSIGGTTLVINIYSSPAPSQSNPTGSPGQTWTLSSSTQLGFLGYITTWHSAIGNYPSNADVWWNYKNTSGVFDPTTTINNVTTSNAPAPKGSIILNAFNQDRAAATTLTGIQAVSTSARPSNGTWFQGRLFYTGVNASTNNTPDNTFYTWTENIYFSQVIVPGDSSSFGKCYETNDPTSETLFDLLPTDGGVIVIQGSGPIYKLFPLQTGLLVFAANGIWFITGSQGGFKATDYTISKISNVQSIASTSFINILGFPIFWNEEGIYYVHPSQNAGSMHTPDIGLNVENLALGTFLTFYNNIPLQSKKFVRGDYNPLEFVVSWVYRSTNESDVTSRYQFDSVLNYNTANKAMYPYSISNSSSSPWVHDIKYITGPGGSTSPDPVFKYLTSILLGSNYNVTFSEEMDETNFTDWFKSGINLNYVSSFIAGYNIKGQAQKRWQPGYVYVFSNNEVNTAYQVYGIFDYGSSTTGTGKYSSIQKITNDISGFANTFRRHRIRGRGLVFQLGITSVDGQPFDIIGWSIWTNINTGV